MAQKNVNKTFGDLMREVKQYIHAPKNLSLIEKAYKYAFAKHEGQPRRNGDPYITHTVQVAYILATLRVGPKTIAAGLLHDVIEDCGVTPKEFVEHFDEEIYTTHWWTPSPKSATCSSPMRRNTRLPTTARS